MNKSDKIREYFSENPDAMVAQVAKNFESSLPMTYKLRNEIRAALLKAPAPGPVSEKDEDVSLSVVLNERGKDYGKFKDGARLMQGMKRLIADHAEAHGKMFNDDQWEALEMIVHKIGRIVNGNPDKIDHWVDIAGYATLVADRLNGIER